MKYLFSVEVTNPADDCLESVRLEWDGLTLAEAKLMNKVTLTRYGVKDYVAKVECFGWKEMK